MFHRTGRRATTALTLISLLTGCGLLPGGEDSSRRIVVGTTSEPSTLDPAASWDNSWELFRNVFQTLVSFPTGSSAPQPDAARSCRFADGDQRVFECELREGLKFTDGERLDASAVKYTFDRILTIKAKGGPAGLLDSLEQVETRGDLTVVFRLKKPDATFPFILATPAMSLVSPGSYPADKLRQDGGVTGSGPYELASYVSGEKAELTRNENYSGFAKRKNGAVTIRYFTDSDKVFEALKKKQVDAVYRGLTSEQVVELEERRPGNEYLQLVETVGADIRYLVFNPADPAAGKLAVRRAVAQVVDRDALVAKVYQGTAEPLYSMVPKGIAGHATSFFDQYGDPSTAKAKRFLEEAGISTPVPLTLWFTSDRYGSGTELEFVELKRQLEASKLFDVTLRSQPWKQFQAGYQKGEYPVFGRGWFPDFPDPDNFVAPFVGKENALSTPYESPEITGKLLPESRRLSDRATVGGHFGRAQQILVEDVRLLPLWQGKLYVASTDDIGGGERALDPQTVMQMWELERKTSW
ncbi:ABC transporter substrate-binding protein [Streptomyces paludis]|uniref:Peptide-binding protein n=1 Tax=Streptomyces paludis TaxID=2282738 RepID=A0A345HJ66_9ACTN|nr:ABC transporter substrate-binding protein [Streptomyces paludis]AXG76740.1 peptide-binding protein [Streptomyces paludis]